MMLGPRGWQSPAELRSLRSLRPLPLSTSSCFAELVSNGPLPLPVPGGGHIRRRSANHRDCFVSHCVCVLGGFSTRDLVFGAPRVQFGRFLHTGPYFWSTSCAFWAVLRTGPCFWSTSCAIWVVFAHRTLFLEHLVCVLGVFAHGTAILNHSVRVLGVFAHGTAILNHSVCVLGVFAHGVSFFELLWQLTYHESNMWRSIWMEPSI